jgi:hypothetical protein
MDRKAIQSSMNFHVWFLDTAEFECVFNIIYLYLICSRNITLEHHSKTGVYFVH